LAKQWRQTVRIETIAGQLSIQGRAIPLFSALQDIFPRSEARGDARAVQDNGPDFFFFLIGLALLMVWLTQQLYL
jgi:hypothetical protein